MKQISAILFSVLLLLTQVAPASMPACCVTGMKPAQACCTLPCCAAKTPDSQSAPAVPAQKPTTQHQISFLALAVVISTLPPIETATFSPAATSPLTSAGAPIYARNCVLLI